MDLPYVLMLTAAVVCTLFICIKYLHIQSSITTNIHGIEVQEAKLEKLRTENNALEMSIKTSVDLDHVYKVATEELGMVYANKDQILHYDKTESEYVRQNEDIPKY
jgi:cell division protein FtsL